MCASVCGGGFYSPQEPLSGVLYDRTGSRACTMHIPRPSSPLGHVFEHPPRCDQWPRAHTTCTFLNQLFELEAMVRASAHSGAGWLSFGGKMIFGGRIMLCFFLKKTGFGNGAALETYVFESLPDILQTVLISGPPPFPNPFNRRFYGTPLGHS